MLTGSFCKISWDNKSRIGKKNWCYYNLAKVKFVKKEKQGLYKERKRKQKVLKYWENKGKKRMDSKKNTENTYRLPHTGKDQTTQDN